ncbi:hypothetical protein PoB_007604900 [Plakobranchus ocellatus]|uniref:Uncharacterized protein n=1 Tax=Plakobranchus ocellatus TaxID=259542 RepID=A0AAV4DZN6_9GAST|nr:hypothetical protein PoB_007604900 [Plakobranchus ocellatus]
MACYVSYVDSNPALRTAWTFLLRVRAPPRVPWPDGGPKSLRPPCCRQAIIQKPNSGQSLIGNLGQAVLFSIVFKIAYKQQQPWEKQKAHRPQWIPAFFSFSVSKRKMIKACSSYTWIFYSTVERHGRPPAACLPLPSSDDPENSSRR